MMGEDKLKFRWSDLPAVSSDLPGTGGETRVELEDFVVTEVPSYLPSGIGAHAYAFVEKRGLTTNDLVAKLRDRGVPDRAIGYAGQKDKYAVTRQWLSVPQEYGTQLTSLDDEEHISVLDSSRHKNKLGLGHLRANQFQIRIRNPESEWQARSKAILERLKEKGLPNYFGPQRFGRFNTNAADAIRLLRGENVPGGRRIHKFYISALQSHLFNWLMKARFENGLYDKVVPGDRAQKHDTGGMFVVEDGDIESPRANQLEISAVLPLHGKKVKVSSDVAGELEQKILDEFELDWSSFKGSQGSRRISRIRLDDVSIEPVDEGYIVDFSLPKGAFATSLLRELMKTEESKDTE